MYKNNKQDVKYPEDDSKPSTSGYNQYKDKTFRDPKLIPTKRNITQVSDQNSDCNRVYRKKFEAKSSINVENGNQSNMSSEEQFPHQQRALYQQVVSVPQMPQINPYANYAYSVPGNFNMDSNQQSYSMMPPFNRYGAMNVQWSCNQVDPMSIPQNNMQVNATPLPVSTGIDMTPNSSGNMNGFNPYMPMANDMYNMMGMATWGHYPMYNPDNVPIAPVNEIISLQSCTLIPPHPGTQIRRRERAPGCKTVFVGCLPENITEEIIREIFSRCGEISTVRMSKKNFCHIRFAAMETVDKAMLLSGYKLKIGNKDDSANSSRIHVDFAVARDDEYELKCLERARLREIRHRERSPTPPPFAHYSPHEANLLCDKLKNEETFNDAINVLIKWLEKGECNRKTCSNFYSMIHCVTSHARRLINKENKRVEEVNKAKFVFQERMGELLLQCNEINKLFNLVKLPHLWDIFNKMEKKKLLSLEQEAKEMVEALSKEVVKERIEEEMDLSDDDCEVVIENAKDKKDLTNDDCVAVNSFNSSKCTNDVTKKDIEKIKKEIDLFRKQLQVAVEEEAALKQEKEKIGFIHNKLFFEKQEKMRAIEAEVKELCQKRKYEQQKFKISNKPDNREGTQSSSLRITQEDMGCIISITSFLGIHPNGANTDDIFNYLRTIKSEISVRYVESLLERYSNLFKAKFSGIGGKTYFVEYKSLVR